jgi:hypothetical protein
MERITAKYFIETPLHPERAAAILAGEQSSGTFVSVPGETEELKQQFAARVESVTPYDTVSEPSIPGYITEKKNITAQILKGRGQFDAGRNTTVSRFCFSQCRRLFFWLLVKPVNGFGYKFFLDNCIWLDYKMEVWPPA